MDRTTELQFNKLEKRYIVGVLTNNFYDRFSTLVCKGIIKKIIKHKGIPVCFVGGFLNDDHFENQHRNKVFKLINSKNVDGIIPLSTPIGTYSKKEECIDFYKSFSTIPFVAVGEEINGNPCVAVNNEKGMHELLTHLITEHNCKKMAFIKGSRHNNDAIARFKAYRDILLKFNIPFDPDLVINGSFHAGHGRIAVTELIDKRKIHFDALICSNDYSAIDAIQELQRRKIKVPGNVIVTGFDDIRECKYLQAPLTTVHQPCFKLGYQTGELMYSVLNGEDNIKSIEINSQLIIRRSCGCNYQEDHSEYNNKRYISDISEILKMNLTINQLEINLSFFKKKLMNIFHLYRLKEIINEYFPHFPVKSCYVFAFNEHRNDCSINASKLMIAYNDYQILETTDKDKLFLPGEIISFCTKNTHGENIYFIYSLVYGDEFLGFIVFAVDKNEIILNENHVMNSGSICEAITLELSRAIKTICDYDELKKQTVIEDESGKKFELPKEVAKRYYKKLINYMEKEKPYINEDLSLYELSVDLEISRNNLSFIINKYSGVNFYDFINSYRLKEAKNIIINNRSGRINILDVAYSSGFKSKSTFNKIFKKFTGMTPSHFREHQFVYE